MLHSKTSALKTLSFHATSCESQGLLKKSGVSLLIKKEIFLRKSPELYKNDCMKLLNLAINF
jgi:hypothetical protein